MERSEQVIAALATMEERIRRACADAGRRRDEVTLVVVTKYHPVSDIETLIQGGVGDIGENREQEASIKMAALRPIWPESELRLHFVGQLQSNKVRRVAAMAHAVHSVDRARLVTALDRATGEALAEHTREAPLHVTIQVDLQPLLSASAAPGRGGAHPEEVLALADHISQCSHLSLAGLMCVAPLDVDPNRAFEVLAELSTTLRTAHPDAWWLSAGMSDDLEAAVSCGATHLRVGSAILGQRPPAQ